MATHDASLPRAYSHRPAGQWPDDEATGSVTLHFDQQHRRRTRLTDDLGRDLLLDLPKAVAMADGDGLHLEDGRWLRVRAAAEVVVEVRHKDPTQLVRLAWHLGNRHLPTEIRDQALRIRPDHVIEEMLLRFDAEVVKVETAFQPEGGAYGSENDHRHHREEPHHHD